MFYFFVKTYTKNVDFLFKLFHFLVYIVPLMIIYIYKNYKQSIYIYIHYSKILNNINNIFLK